MSDITIQNRQYEFYCVEKQSDPCAIIIFGASGDLTHRKIIPSLWSLFKKKLLPESFFVAGCSRTEMTDEAFRKKAHRALEVKPDTKGGVEPEHFLRHLYYISGDYGSAELYRSLDKRLSALEKKHSTSGNRIFYLATPPQLFTVIVKGLSEERLISEDKQKSSSIRVIFEKPFGYDLESARRLNADLQNYLNEPQIYRIDHYLGKETVQNIMMLRFANTVFEPVWNRQYIDNIQITAAESVGVEHRTGYYEQAGCLRDMFQNHMLQMLALVAMEPAISFDADRVRDEKVKILRTIRPFSLDNLGNEIVRGQYVSGEIDGKPVPGYGEEENVAPGSFTETFVAAKFLIDNWRWKGVPFYLRSGKRMARKVTEIAVTFKHVPHSLFAPFSPELLPANVLVLNIQPEDGFSLNIQAKHPGPKLCMSTLSMDFRYHEAFGFEMPDAYERLILDCMQGDQTLFIRSDALEVTWSLFTPVLEAWQNDEKNKEAGELHTYSAGSWGPEASYSLIEQDGRKWRIQ